MFKKKFGAIKKISEEETLVFDSRLISNIIMRGETVDIIYLGEPVIDVELRQYTGHNDASGEEIYEGHLGKYGETDGEPFYAVVVFYEELAEFMLEIHDGEDITYASLVDDDGTPPRDWFTISGNIWENKELLI